MKISINKKAIKITAICLLIAVVATSIILGIYYGVVYNANVTLSIDYNSKQQTIEGFGASSAWTYQNLGKEDDATINETMAMLYGDSGLELNTFRYNIGGGSKEEKFNTVEPYSNDWFDIDRRAESFFIAENYVNDESFKDVNNYDFINRDAAVMKCFKAALDTGNITRVVFFVNSPHYLMTESGKCTGEYINQNNLKPSSYQAFSDYLMVIVNYLYENVISPVSKDIEVIISPTNEPQWKWGGSDATQEGCHYDPEVLAKYYENFFKTLKEFNTTHNTNFIGDAFESGNYKLYSTSKVDIQQYLDAMSKYDYFDEIKHISVHTYAANDSISIRNKFAKFMKKNYPDISISATEFCEMEWGRFDTIESGLFLAKVIMRDLTMINATDWSWWLSVACGDYNDGLVYWDKVDGANQLSVLKRYYTMAHFTKYLDKGDVRVDTKLNLATKGLDIAAFQKADGSTVLIVINEGATRTISLANEFSSYQATTTTAENNLIETQGTDTSSFVIEKNSISTIILK